MTTTALPEGQSVKSAARTVAVLDFFASNPGFHSLAAVQERLGYPKSSLYVLLRTLVDLSWVETDPAGTSYRIGLRALLVGTSYIDSDDVVAAARGALDGLAEMTTETCHLARLDGSDVVYLTTRESQHYLRPFSRVGRRLPAHATALGKALLAARDDDEIQSILPAALQPLTSRTIVDHSRLARDLARTRKRGYSVDREENTVGLRCFAVALEYQRPARDAISCSIPVARLSGDRESEIVEALMTAREEIDHLVRANRRHG